MNFGGEQFKVNLVRVGRVLKACQILSGQGKHDIFNLNTQVEWGHAKQLFPFTNGLQRQGVGRVFGWCGFSNLVGF